MRQTRLTLNELDTSFSDVDTNIETENVLDLKLLNPSILTNMNLKFKQVLDPNLTNLESTAFDEKEIREFKSSNEKKGNAAFKNEYG